MKRPKFRAHVAALFFSACASSASGQAFREEFGSGDCSTVPFPSGWTRFDVDNLVPNFAVRRFTQAWLVGLDPELPGCVAESTSWYDPPGTANDFMCSPQFVVPATRPVLQWRARGSTKFPDGYEVRVVSGSPPSGGAGNIGNLLSGPVLFSTPAEAPGWRTRRYMMEAFAGQLLSLCFRNNTFDGSVLGIDDVEVFEGVVDVEVSLPEPSGFEYTRVPANAGYLVAPAIRVTNVGNYPFDTARVTASISDAFGLRAVVEAAPIDSLAFGATADAMFPSATQEIDTPGEWTVSYHASTSPEDGAAANDQVSETVLAGNELARDDGIFAGDVVLGGGEEEELGHEFELIRSTKVTAIRVVLDLDSDATGLPVVARLRRLDPTSNRPGEIVASTQQAISVAGRAEYTLSFASGGLELAPGRYLGTVVAPPLPANIDYFVVVGSREVPHSKAWFRNGAFWWNYVELELPPEDDNAVHLRLLVEPNPRVFFNGFESSPTRPRPPSAIFE